MAGTLVKCTFILFLVAMVTGQMTTPTPFSFQSKQYNNMKETPLDYPDVNSLDADFPADDVDDRSASDTVMYVDNGDYANQQPAPPPPPPQSQNAPDAKDEGIDVGDFLDTLPFDADRYSQFGGFGSAELYRLLALGPQQSDPALGFRLSGLFNRMAPKMKAPIDNLDHCPDRPEIGIQYYCMKLEDGLYFDPWNPWCGYIECSDGVAERVCCKQGTWLGPMLMLKSTFKTNQNELCRRPLLAKISDDAKCPMPSTMDICRAAIKVEKMNPPKKKIKIPINQFSQGDFGQFSRIKTAVAPEPAPSADRSATVADTHTKTHNQDGEQNT